MPGAVPAERIRRRGRGRARALFALGAALAAHAVAILLFHYAGPDLRSVPLAASRAASASGSATEERPLEISSLVETLAAPDAPTPEEKKREEKAKKEEERKDIKGQIVDLAKPAIEQRPDEARFLSEYDSKVDRETRGKIARDKAGGVQAPPPAQAPAEQSTPREAGRGGKQGAPGTTQLAAARPKVRSSDGHDGLTAADDGQLRQRRGSSSRNEIEAASREGRAAPVPSPSGVGGDDGDGHEAQEGAEGSANPHPNLAATPEMLQRAIGPGAGSMDYLKNIDDGDSTALNSKKTKFATFFNRVKRAVAQEWNPTAVYVQHDPSGNVYGVKDRVTVLRVSLDPDGKLAATNIIESSGVGFLDDEAVDAFRRAKNFPNPPKDLIEADGRIHFTFGFIFELSGRTSFKVYKYR